MAGIAKIFLASLHEAGNFPACNKNVKDKKLEMRYFNVHTYTFCVQFGDDNFNSYFDVTSSFSFHHLRRSSSPVTGSFM